MISIEDVVRSSVKVSEFDKHLKKAGGHIDRNVVEVTIKMKTIVRKTLMIKITSSCYDSVKNSILFGHVSAGDSVGQPLFCKFLHSFRSTNCHILEIYKALFSQVQRPRIVFTYCYTYERAAHLNWSTNCGRDTEIPPLMNLRNFDKLRGQGSLANIVSIQKIRKIKTTIPEMTSLKCCLAYVYIFG